MVKVIFTELMEDFKNNSKHFLKKKNLIDVVNMLEVYRESSAKVIFCPSSIFMNPSCISHLKA